MTQEPVFRGEGVDAGEKALHPVEATRIVRSFFESDELVAAALAGTVPALSDIGCLCGGVMDREDPESGDSEEALVLASGRKKVGAYRASGGELLVGDKTAKDERVRKEEAATGAEDAEDLFQQICATWDVADDVVGKNRVEGRGSEGQRLRRVALLEIGERRDSIDTRKPPGACDGVGVQFETGDATADTARQVEGVEAGAAAYLEDVGASTHIEKCGDAFGLFGRDPTGLAEVLAVGFGADLAVEVVLDSGVGVVVEIDLGRHGFVLPRRADCTTERPHQPPLREYEVES